MPGLKLSHLMILVKGPHFTSRVTHLLHVLLGLVEVFRWFFWHRLVLSIFIFHAWDGVGLELLLNKRNARTKCIVQQEYEYDVMARKYCPHCGPFVMEINCSLRVDSPHKGPTATIFRSFKDPVASLPNKLVKQRWFDRKTPLRSCDVDVNICI